VESKSVENTIFSGLSAEQQEGYIRQVRNTIQKGEIVHSGMLDLA